MNITHPMLAARLKDISQLRYPCLMTPKLDGVRCIKLNGNAHTRSLKLIQNYHIRSLIEQHLPDGIDGEIVVPGADFSSAQSAVMRRTGTPDFEFHAFDMAGEGLYIERVKNLVHWRGNVRPFILRVLVPEYAYNLDEFQRYEDRCLEQGYEGVITRTVDSPYKCGRSTPTEQWMVKWKRYTDTEALITGFIEQMRNDNEVQYNEAGRAHRPGGQAHHHPKGTLGSLVAESALHGTINVGTGLTEALRQEIWSNQAHYLGKVFTYRWQQCGTKDKPRFPSFVGFREELV